MRQQDLEDLRDLLDEYAHNLRDRIEYAENVRKRDPVQVRGEIANLRQIGRLVLEVQKDLQVR